MRVLIDQQLPIGDVVLEAVPRAGQRVAVKQAGADRAATMEA